MARQTSVCGRILLPDMGIAELDYDGLNGWFLLSNIVVIIGIIPNISEF
jgi:hypothetical protein